MNKKIFWTGVNFFCILLLLAGCGISGGNFGRQQVSVSNTTEAFGTIITITLYGEEEEQLNQLIETSFEKCRELEKIFSAKLPDSELSRLNETACQEPVQVSEELFEVMKKAQDYNQLSKGSLDVSIGQMIHLWGIGTEDAKIPSEEELKPLLRQAGSQTMVLDEKNRTIRYLSEKVQADLGAIAKGYAADAVHEYLAGQKSVEGGLLNFGGNILAFGEKQGSDQWNIGITDPLRPDMICGAVTITDQSVVTSGNYERYFEEDGVRYHHILDPFTGYPAEAGVISATIIGEQAADCDALSTACYILGVDKALSLIEDINGVECILIDEEGHFHCSSGIKKYHFREAE